MFESRLTVARLDRKVFEEVTCLPDDQKSSKQWRLDGMLKMCEQNLKIAQDQNPENLKEKVANGNPISRTWKNGEVAPQAGPLLMSDVKGQSSLFPSL